MLVLRGLCLLGLMFLTPEIVFFTILKCLIEKEMHKNPQNYRESMSKAKLFKKKIASMIQYSTLNMNGILLQKTQKIYKELFFFD